MVDAGRDGRHVKGRAGKQDLAKHYGFSDEEPDVVVNDDIKYRTYRVETRTNEACRSVQQVFRRSTSN